MLLLPPAPESSVIDRYRKHTKTANMVKPLQPSAYSRLYRLATNRTQYRSCRTVANVDRMALWEKGEKKMGKDVSD